MRNWPAIEISGFRARPPFEGDNESPASPSPDLLLAALADHDVSAVEELTGDTWRIFFPTAASRDTARETLGGQFSGLTLDAIDIPDEDWAARSQASLRAIRVGDLIVAPPWDVPADNDGAPIVIVIQPSMGFGTGHHATTRLCLAALQAMDLRGMRVIDVGTGSGVLALAASRLGATDVLGIDEDPDAIQSAHENVVLNPGVVVALQVVDLRFAAPSPSDVVLANLTGGLLVAAAPRLQALTLPGGRLILSGFLAHEEEEVLRAFGTCQAESHMQEDEWRSVVLHRRAIP